jgi:SagB-type dehydrogenase family enzyme
VYIQLLGAILSECSGMKNKWVLIAILCFFLILLGGAMFNRFKRQDRPSRINSGELITLPQPVLDSKISIEAALQERRSIRDYYTPESLSISEISQLLWAAQGITRPGGYRTAPSAGALYPLEVFLVSGQVDNLPAGVYRYKPEEHGLNLVLTGDILEELSAAALGQDAIRNAPAAIVITGIFERTMVKYGNRGIQYVHMEVGGAAENIYLQAESLDLGTVFIGAFHDDQVSQVLNLDDQEEPLCIMPVGKPRR